LLAYPDAAASNRAVRVTEVERSESTAGTELLVSLKIEQAHGSNDMQRVPLQIEIDGARSELTVELNGTEVEIKGHSIPLEAAQVRGWGRVSLPADANPADNEFYFVYDKSPPRKTLIVADDADLVRPLHLAAGIPPEASVVCDVTVIPPADLIGADWEGTSLVLWHSALPQAGAAPELESYIKRGGRVICFPPEAPDDAEFAGVKWGAWQELSTETPVATWIGDQDLLANARSGASLPVGQLRVARYCGLAGDITSLATLAGGAPLLARALTDERNIYFCTATVGTDSSSLARDGVVLYVLIQRALAAGAAMLGTARQVFAGELSADRVSEWRAVSDPGDVLSTTYNVHPGVYSVGERLVAVNRSAAEDQPVRVADARVAGLFERLEFDRVDDRAGSGTSLLEEIWRTFLALMMAALILEACLCIPKLVAAHPPQTAGFAKPPPGHQASTNGLAAAKGVSA
jgi:hypothetical protein